MKQTREFVEEEQEMKREKLEIKRNEHKLKMRLMELKSERKSNDMKCKNEEHAKLMAIHSMTLKIKEMEFAVQKKTS